MAKSSPAIDRAVRIELLRAKAALQRETLVHDLQAASRSLTPANALRGLWPGLAGAKGGAAAGASGLLLQAYSLWRRYPFVASTLSALALGGGRKAHVLKAAVGAIVAWKIFKTWRDTPPDDDRAPRDR